MTTKNKPKFKAKQQQLHKQCTDSHRQSFRAVLRVMPRYHVIVSCDFVAWPRFLYVEDSFT